ncbi:hypothetical protein [Methylogaea oryzae]|uniref:Uncharacterized protein n=1 Tax=Methylogaea oryzae TaxID=1295382 RepID=A0A8D5ALQ4_9GAMM|nr:hypothetical protein [Methylogaea oryzae]BBL70350.1 hypothetical protein MoryE10_09560 [Methylogaea oryzae]
MSHTKRSFIQAKFEPLRIKPEQWPEALERLEQGWDFLSAAGYGAAKPHEPRETGVDWYGRLSGAERAAFDRFWKAYGYKKGKNNAAMVWHRLGEIDAATAEIIIQAATAEKRQWGKEETRDGIARKWPQGWLSERRWEDHEPSADTAKTAPGAAVKRANLVNEINGLKTLIASAKPGPGREAMEAKLAALEAQLRG